MMPRKQENSREDVISSPVLQWSYAEKGQINGHGQMGKTVSCFHKMTMSFSTERFEVLKKWLIRKIVTALAILGLGVQNVSQKTNRKKYKGLWVKHCYHLSFNHLWTTDFSIRLEANWGKIQAHFRMNGFLLQCLGQSIVGWETEGLPVRCVSCFGTSQLSDLEPLNFCTFLFFPVKTHRTKYHRT